MFNFFHTHYFKLSDTNPDIIFCDCGEVRVLDTLNVSITEKLVREDLRKLAENSEEIKKLMYS